MSDERTAAPAGDLTPLPPSELRAKVKRAQGEGGELRYALALDEPSSASAREASFVWLCVPGVPGCERDFRHLSPYLALSAPVVRLTLPGFGVLDDALDAPSTTTERARYIERVIRAEGWSAVHLIGHSMGGPASLLVAGRCPCLLYTSPSPRD